MLATYPWRGDVRPAAGLPYSCDHVVPVLVLNCLRAHHCPVLLLTVLLTVPPCVDTDLRGDNITVVATSSGISITAKNINATVQVKHSSGSGLGSCVSAGGGNEPPNVPFAVRTRSPTHPYTLRAQSNGAQPQLSHPPPARRATCTLSDDYMQSQRPYCISLGAVGSPVCMCDTPHPWP